MKKKQKKEGVWSDRTVPGWKIYEPPPVGTRPGILIQMPAVLCLPHDMSGTP